MFISHFNTFTKAYFFIHTAACSNYPHLQHGCSICASSIFLLWLTFCLYFVFLNSSFCIRIKAAILQIATWNFHLNSKWREAQRKAESAPEVSLGLVAQGCVLAAGFGERRAQVWCGLCRWHWWHTCILCARLCQANHIQNEEERVGLSF